MPSMRFGVLLVVAVLTNRPAVGSAQQAAGARLAELGQPDSAGFAIARRLAVALGTFAGTAPITVIPSDEIEEITRQGYYSSAASVTADDFRAIAVQARASVFIGIVRIKDSVEVFIATPTRARERHLGRWVLVDMPIVSLVRAIDSDSGFVRVRGGG